MTIVAGSRQAGHWSSNWELHIQIHRQQVQIDKEWAWHPQVTHLLQKGQPPNLSPVVPTGDPAFKFMGLRLLFLLTPHKHTGMTQAQWASRHLDLCTPHHINHANSVPSHMQTMWKHATLKWEEENNSSYHARFNTLSVREKASHSS